jgi:hypothetical protein
MKSLTWKDVVARRVARSGLAERQPAERLSDVVRDTCGLQAQLLLAAELGIEARIDNVSRSDVHAALWERRELVKAHTVRGTIHLHPAVDLALYFAAIREAGWWRDPRYLRPRRITAEQLDSVTGAARDALDGRALTYRELEAEIVARVGPWAATPVPERPFGQDDWGVWRQLLVPAEGPFCFGPKRGNQVTLVRADQWIADWHDIWSTGALEEVLRRYLRAYGPATEGDFAHWFSIPPRRARDVFGSLADEITEVNVEGFRAWLLAQPDRPPATGNHSVRLLPDYDCYLIGCHPPGEQRARLIPSESGSQIFGGGAGPFAAVVVDGRAIGVWKRRAVGKRLEVRVQLFGGISARVRRGIAEEAGRVADYLEFSASLSLVV